jgi:hypothetical protein
VHVDCEAIDRILLQLDEISMSSPGFKKKNSLLGNFCSFLGSFSLILGECTPNDIRRHLVWKDSRWKTIVHKLFCPFLGSKSNSECNCPRRLASGTIEDIFQQLIQIFDEKGFGRYWDIVSGTGNPAASPLVKEYLKLIREEQARAHVLPKQAKPIFLSKVGAIALFIDRELRRDDVNVRERYVLFRDQAWLKLQFFTGYRASDLFLTVAQEVKCLADGSGLVFKHTFGNTLRGDKGKSNSFVIKRYTDLVVCPVRVC